MKMDSFVFYRSFYEAIKGLPDEDRLNAFDAICEYALDHNEIEKTPVVNGMMILIVPQLDANYKRRASGLQGGRPKTAQSGEESEDKADNQGTNHNQDETKAKPKQNQSITKSKPNDNQTITKGKPNVNVNVNANVNANGNEDIKGPPECSEAFTQALKDFSDMRKKIKKPLTDRAKQMILNKLSKLSTDEQEQIEILNQSILHSWQDVYPLKGEGQRYGKTNAFEELMKV